MTTFIHDKNPKSTEIETKLKELPKCPGICIFIDIVNSTTVKYSTPIEDWGKKLNNTFNFISFLNDFPENVVKGIGDEIMLYIPDEDLKSKTSYNDLYSLLEEIYATFDNIKNFPLDDIFMTCKASIHYCTEVYNITFFEGANDYYGRDIDISARLMSKSKEHRVVISEKFYQKMMEDVSNKNQGCLSAISEKFIEDFKGVPEYIEFRIMDV